MPKGPWNRKTFLLACLRVHGIVKPGLGGGEVGDDGWWREKMQQGRKISRMRMEPAATAKSSQGCKYCWSLYSSSFFLILKMKQSMQILLEKVTVLDYLQAHLEKNRSWRKASSSGALSLAHVPAGRWFPRAVGKRSSGKRRRPGKEEGDARLPASSAPEGRSQPVATTAPHHCTFPAIVAALLPRPCRRIRGNRGPGASSWLPRAPGGREQGQDEAAS
jgi:hypothetical protein